MPKRTSEELFAENEELRQRLAALEAAAREHQQAEDNLSRALDELRNEIQARTAQLQRAAEELTIFKRFAEASSQGFGMADMNGMVTYLNPALCRMAGVARPEDAVGTHLSRYYPEGYMARREKEVLPALLREGHWEAELSVSRQGKTTYALQNSFLIRDENGNPSHLASVITDITERKRTEAEILQARAEAELRANELEALMDAVPAGVMITRDRDGLQIYGNRAAHELLRVPVCETNISKSVPDPNRARTYRPCRNGLEIPPSDLPIQRAARGEEVRGWDCEILFDDGEIRHVVVDATPLYDENGESRGAIAAFIDVTHRKRAEKELADAKAAADAANQAKSEFLANMSHEIRTPMTAVLGFTDLILQSKCSHHEQREFLQIVQQSGKNLLQLIDDILDLSKIEAGRVTIESLECSTQQLLSEVMTLMEVRAREKNLCLEVDYRHPFPAAIRTDPTRLREILVNLVGNAVKFTERGRIRVAPRLAGTPSQPKIAFAVADTGIGMAPDQLSEIFRPFHQADASMTRRFGGTGLGLTICRRLAQMLGGDITVDSQLGKGSTFTLTIDAGRDAGRTLIHPPAPRAARPENHPAQPMLAGRVLIVEDTPENRLLVSSVLDKAGIATDAVGNGLEALQAVHAACANGQPYDLILMDVQMPGMDGFEATRRLRAQGWRGSIIALTAHAMDGDRQKCLDAGCNDYLPKPVDWQQMLSKMAHYLKPSSRFASRSAKSE